MDPRGAAPARRARLRLGRRVRQAEGVFRTDLPPGWLVTVIYSLFHAAAEDVNVGRLRPADVAGVLEATLLPMLAVR